MRVSSWCFLAACASSVVGEDAPIFESRNEIKQGSSIQLESRQQAGVVATSSNFLRRAYHGSVVVGNYVYIDGGSFSYSSSSGSPQFEYSTTTLSIDLSKSWTNSSVTINSNSKPNGVPNLDDGILWYDSKANALYSGFIGAAPRFNTPSPSPLGLWSFALDGQGGGSWSAVSAATTQISSSFTRPRAGLSTWGGETAVTIGGYIDSLTSPATVNYTSVKPIPGLVQYNMTSGTFKNSSASGYNLNGTAERGVLHYVPSFGPQGIFLLLGGDISDLNSYTPGHNLQSFANLTIYDPSSGNFYNQTATGNIPEGRIGFCVTGVNSTNGTYEIFVYAGWGSNLGSAALPFDEIYILTLPAFEWIKVNYPPTNPRHGHTCNTVGNRQMLIIGGVDSSQDTTNSVSTTLDKATFATKDIFTQGLAIFDMTTLSFTSQYNASAAVYEQSDPVKTYYAQHSRDPATWGSSELQTLFQTTHFTSTNSSSASNPTSTSTPSSSSSSNTGAIVGGVVGGVLGLALLAGLIFFCWRRQHRKRATAELPNNMQAAGGPSFGGAVEEYKYQAPVSEAPTESGVYQMPTPENDATGTPHFPSELPARQHHELP